MPESQIGLASFLIHGTVVFLESALLPWLPGRRFHSNCVLPFSCAWIAVLLVPPVYHGLGRVSAFPFDDLVVMSVLAAPAFLPPAFLGSMLTVWIQGGFEAVAMEEGDEPDAPVA